MKIKIQLDYFKNTAKHCKNNKFNLNNKPLSSSLIYLEDDVASPWLTTRHCAICLLALVLLDSLFQVQKSVYCKEQNKKQK